MGVLTRNIDFKDNGCDIQKPFASSYSINVVKDSGLDIDVKESLISRMRKSSKKKYANIPSYINEGSSRMFTTVSGSDIDNIIIKSSLSNIHQFVDATELELDRKIDDFHEFIAQSEYASVADYVENGLEAVPLDIDHIFPSTLDYWATGDIDWDECDDVGGLLVRNIVKFQSDDWYDEFLKRVEDIVRAKRLLKALSKRINFLLNLVKKRLRNLRQVFNKQHSFHFKNLDDYHDTSFNYVTVS